MIAFSSKTSPTSFWRSKAFRLSLGLLVGILIAVSGLVGITQTPAGRAFIETQIKDYVRETYQIHMSFADSEFYRESGEWHLGVSDLKLQREASEPVTFKRLSARLNTLTIWNKAKFRVNLSVEGAKLDISLSPQEIKVPSLGLAFSPAELQGFLDEPSDREGESKTLESIRWRDIALDLEYGSELKDRWTVATSGEWHQPTTIRSLSLKASRLDLAKLLGTLRAFTYEVPKLSKGYSALAKTTLLDAGILDGITIECQSLSSCVGDASFENFTLKAEGKSPGLQGFHAKVKAEANQVTVALPESKLTLASSYLSPTPLPLALSPTAIVIRFKEETIDVELPRTSFVFDGTSAETDATLSIPTQTPSQTTMAIKISGRGAKLLTVFERLPKELIGTKVKDWLTTKFKRGEVDDFAVSIEGTLPKTPLVKVNAAFHDVQLKFLDDWPLLTSCRGEFRMHGLAMSIPVETCRSAKVTADQALVEISGIEEDKARIAIQLKAKSPVKGAFEYLALSPLKSLGEAFLSIPVLGAEQITNLAIHAPLGSGSAEPVKVEGSSVLKGVHFAIQGGIFIGKSPEIRLAFDKNGLKQLSGEIISPADRSQVELRRDEKGDYLSGTIREASPSENPLRGSFKILPANSPEIVIAILQGYKPSQGGASIDFRSLRWQLGSKQSLGLAGRADVHNLGLLSELFGLKGNFRKGKGSLDFDLTIADLKSKLGAPVIDGNLTFDLKEGEILKLPRTAVSLVEFANLNALGLNSDAMPYDTMKGRLDFSKGKVKVDRSNFDLGIIEARMSGDIDYTSKQLNLSLEIIPNLGSPAAAIAIGLWNPLLGLGLFGLSQLQEKSSNSVINRVISQTYKIEGPMDDSKIHLIRPFNIKAIFGD